MHHPEFEPRGRYRVLRQCCVALCFMAAAFMRAADPQDDPRLEQARQAAAVESVPLYKVLAHEYPESAVIWYELGNVLSETGQWQDALDSFEHALKGHHKVVTTLSRIGKAHAKLKRFSDAEGAYRRSLEQDPANVAAQFGLGSALFSQDKNAEALPFFEKIALGVDEWAPVAREYLAQIYFDLQRHGQALLILHDLLKTAPDSANLRWLLAKTLLKLREYEPALQEFNWVVEHDPTRKAAATYYMGASLEGLDRPRDAEDRYAQVEKGDAVWHKAAHEARRALSGKAFHFTLDETVGYETGISSNDDIAPVKGKDGYNELFLSVQGRAHRTRNLSLWLGVDHYSLNYFKLTQNDYQQTAAKLELRFGRVGPLQELMLRYRLQYAEIDHRSYQLENILEAIGTMERGPQRVRFGVSATASRHFRSFDALSGPLAGGFMEYRRSLPLWEHEVQMRASAEYRFSEAASLERLSDRISLQYRAQIWDVVYGQLRTQYRRDDFLELNLGGVRRVDHRLTGHVEFDAQVHQRISINWGYLYESQDSRLQTQEYGRHQISTGFTLRF